MGAAALRVDNSWLFVELGIMVIGLAVLARVASRFGFSAIPLYLVAGLAFGDGGLAPLRVGEQFVSIGAEVGVVLLLFMLGLEYSGEKLLQNLRAGATNGFIDLVLNFSPGVLAGALLGLHPLAAVLLGGVTYISSSGVIAKILSELNRSRNPETSSVISVLVLEDLAMAVYLPVVAVLLAGEGLAQGAVSVLVALATVMMVLLLAVRYGSRISDFVSHQSDEIVLLSTLGLILLVAGVAQQLQVSAAIGAFLVGVAISGPLTERAGQLIAPLRDLFAATFFLFFGLKIDPAGIWPSLPVAIALGAATIATKILTGLWIGKRSGLTRAESVRLGATLVARGEFSVVIAGLGTILEPGLGPLAASYVLITAICGPLLARFAGPASTPAPG